MELLDKPETQLAVYAPFYAELAILEQSNSAIVFDYESKKGNKEARSHVFSLRKSKAELERTRKDENESHQVAIKAVNNEAKEILGRIEAMIEVHQVKLDEIEQREIDRIAGIKERIASLAAIHSDISIAALENHIVMLACTEIDLSFAEFSAEAAGARASSIIKHRELLDAKRQAEAEATELLELRKMAAAQKAKDAEAAAIKAAAELAERQRIDAEIKEREIAAKLAIQAQQREADLLANAEREKAEAIKAEQEKFAEMVAEAKRVEAAEAAEQAKREANTQHKGRINREALAGFAAVLDLPEEQAKFIIKLIAHGKIPHISINY